jgi:biotin carboxylase
MPRVLFLMPTKTYRAGAFLKAARRIEIDAVVASDRRQALETFTQGKTLTLNFYDLEGVKQAIVEFAAKYPLDAIIPADDDTTVIAAVASEALGLPFNSAGAVRAAREKHRLREILTEANLPAPKFRLFSNKENPKEISQKVEYPCVLKPAFLSASRGVIRADNPDEFLKAFRRITNILKEPEVTKRGGETAHRILVEDYIPGDEVALEGILTHGKLKVLAIFDKPDPLVGPFFEETIYVTPSRLKVNVQEKIITCAANAANALGLSFGPVHAEIRINESGPWLIEIAARSIGGICSRVLRFSNGISLEELILRHALGMEIDSLQREELASGVMMIPIPKAGKLSEVRGLNDASAVPGIEDVRITIPLGQKLIPLPEGTQYLGFIFARAEHPAMVENAIREAHRRLEFVIAPS